MHEVGQQEDVVSRRKLVAHGVARGDVDAIVDAGVGHASARDVGHDRQVEHGGVQIRIGTSQRDRPRAGAATDVQHSLVPAEVDCVWKGGRRACQDRLNTG